MYVKKEYDVWLFTLFLLILIWLKYSVVDVWFFIFIIGFCWLLANIGAEFWLDASKGGESWKRTFFVNFGVVIFGSLYLRTNKFSINFINERNDKFYYIVKLLRWHNMLIKRRCLHRDSSIKGKSVELSQILLDFLI